MLNYMSGPQNNSYEEEVDKLLSLLSEGEVTGKEEVAKKKNELKQKMKKMMLQFKSPSMKQSQESKELKVEIECMSRKAAGLNCNTQSSSINRKNLHDHVALEERYDTDAEDVVRWRTIIIEELESINSLLKMRKSINVKDGLVNIWLDRLNNTKSMSKSITSIMEEKVNEIKKEEESCKTEILNIRKKKKSKVAHEELEVAKNNLKDVEARKKTWAKRKRMTESLGNKLGSASTIYDRNASKESLYKYQPKIHKANRVKRPEDK